MMCIVEFDCSFFSVCIRLLDLSGATCVSSSLRQFSYSWLALSSRAWSVQWFWLFIHYCILLSVLWCYWLGASNGITQTAFYWLFPGDPGWVYCPL